MSTLIATNGNITNVNTGTIKNSTGNTTAMTIDSVVVLHNPKNHISLPKSKEAAIQLLHLLDLLERCHIMLFLGLLEYP